MYSSNDKHLCSTIYLQNANGLLRELNPGPLAPEARIMPLDQAANVNYASIVCQLSSMHQLETKVTLQSLLLESTFQRNSGCALSAYRLVPPAQDPFSIGGMSLPWHASAWNFWWLVQEKQCRCLGNWCPSKMPSIRIEASCLCVRQYIHEIRSPGIEPGTIWLLHESTVRCSTNWAMTGLWELVLLSSLQHFASFFVILISMNQSPGRRNWTSACLHAPWVEVMSKHLPDSPRHSVQKCEKSKLVQQYNQGLSACNTTICKLEPTLQCRSCSAKNESAA